MKKGVLLAMFALWSVAGFSQVSWNAKVGMNISNFTGDLDVSAKVGVKLGVGMEYAFNDTWLLQPSLFLSQKGAKFSATIYSNEAEIKFNAMYFELPIMMAACIYVTDHTNIVISAGPYLACGVGGKTRTKVSGGGSNMDIKEKTFGSDAFDRFDAGLGAGVAVEFGRIVVGIDGQFGLVELADLGLDSNPKNINCAITLGYRF